MSNDNYNPELRPYNYTGIGPDDNYQQFHRMFTLFHILWQLKIDRTEGWLTTDIKAAMLRINVDMKANVDDAI